MDTPWIYKNMFFTEVFESLVRELDYKGIKIFS